MLGPARPSTASGGLFAWNAFTAATVVGPSTPSAASANSPSAASRRWMQATPSPRAPAGRLASAVHAGAAAAAACAAGAPPMPIADRVSASAAPVATNGGCAVW